MLAQTSSDPAWFDDNPHNDPDTPNFCFIYWDCETDADWTAGWRAWHERGTAYDNGYDYRRYAAMRGIRRLDHRYGDPNLCHSAWTCRTDAEWVRGYERGRDIFTLKPTIAATPPVVAERTVVSTVVSTVVRTVVKQIYVVVTATATPTETPLQVQPPGEPENPVQPPVENGNRVGDGIELMPTETPTPKPDLEPCPDGQVRLGISQTCQQPLILQPG